MHRKAVSYIIFSTFLFSIMNVFVKMLPGIPSYEIVLFRSVVSLTLSWYMLRINHIHPLGNKKQRIFLILRGLAGSTALLLFFYTLQHMHLATAVTIQYLSPIFTIIFASILLKEKIGLNQWIFFAVSFAGILLIKGFDPHASLKLLLLGILAAACSGIAYNAVRKVKDDQPALVVVFYLPLTTVPIITPYCATHWVMPSGIEWFWLAGVGLLTQFAQLYMTRAYQMEKAGNIANYAYLGMVFALFFGYIIFHETIGMEAISGMLLVIAGVIGNYLYVNRVTSAKRFLVYLRSFPGI